MSLQNSLDRANLRIWLDRFALERDVKFSRPLLDNLYSDYKELAGEHPEVEKYIGVEDLSSGKIHSLMLELVQPSVELLENVQKPDQIPPSHNKDLLETFQDNLSALKLGTKDMYTNQLMLIYDRLEFAVGIALENNMFYVCSKVVKDIIDEDNHPVFGNGEKNLTETLEWVYNELIKQFSGTEGVAAPVATFTLSDVEDGLKSSLEKENYAEAKQILLDFWSNSERLVKKYTKVFFTSNSLIERSLVDHLMIALQDNIEYLAEKEHVSEATVVQTSSVVFYLNSMVKEHDFGLKKSNSF